MDSKKKNLLSLVLSLCSVYGDYSVDINDIYVDDKEVMDCQFKLYMVMLASDPELSDKLFLEFEELYNKLIDLNAKDLAKTYSKINMPICNATE